MFRRFQETPRLVLTQAAMLLVAGCMIGGAFVMQVNAQTAPPTQTLPKDAPTPLPVPVLVVKNDPFVPLVTTTLHAAQQTPNEKKGQMTSGPAQPMTLCMTIALPPPVADVMVGTQHFTVGLGDELLPGEKVVQIDANDLQLSDGTTLVQSGSIACVPGTDTNSQYSPGPNNNQNGAYILPVGQSAGSQQGGPNPLTTTNGGAGNAAIPSSGATPSGSTIFVPSPAPLATQAPYNTYNQLYGQPMPTPPPQPMYYRPTPQPQGSP